MAGQALIGILEPGAVIREKIVERQPCAESGASREASAVERQQEGQGMNEVRGDTLPDAPLLQGLTDQAKFEIAQVAQTAMNELGVVGARRVGEIVALDQRDLQATQARITRDARA